MINIKVLIVLGTRPEIIKFEPIIRILKQRNDVEAIVVHTGQHYDYLMWKAFLEDLSISDPDYSLEVKGNTSMQRLSQMIVGLEKIILSEVPNAVLILGDTDSALAGAITARRLSVPLVHIEAGLRSFNMNSPEELTRRIIAQLALVHFAPTNLAKFFLIREGIPKDRIFVVGNTIVDVLFKMLPYISRETKLDPNMILTTIHRPENVDIEENLRNVTAILLSLAKHYHLVFPLHPRTRNRLEKFNLLKELLDSNIEISEPKRYTEFLKLLCNSSLVITDSGGLQEESVSLGKKIIVIRPTTPRWEAVLAGYTYLANLNNNLIITLAKKLIEENRKNMSSRDCRVVNFMYGDGLAGQRIVKILMELYTNGKLVYRSPDLSGKELDIVKLFLKNYLGGILNETDKDQGNII